MPRATLEILEGRTLEQKRKLVEGICVVMEDVLYQKDIKQVGCMVLILEVSPENLASNSELISDAYARGESFAGKPEPRLTIQYVEGRIHSMEQRRELVQRMSDLISEVLGCPKENVLIFLLEMPKTGFACYGTMRCDDDSQKAGK